MTDSSKPFAIHVVCTGNICRSAFAASYLRQRLSQLAPGAFVVTSSGTGWYRGLEVPPPIRDLAQRHGITVDDHEPRYAVRAHYEAADLILAATRDHRQIILAEAPSALKRTFTVGEFADLLRWTSAAPGADPDAWRAAVRTAAMHRPSVVPSDIPDPYGLPREAYDEMAATLLPALDVILEAAGASAG